MYYFKIILFIIAFVTVDLITKYRFYDLGLLPNIWTATFNTGISFGIGANLVYIKLITLLFLIILLYLLCTKKIHPTAGILLVSGSIGNLLDRALLGGVRDFIRLGFGAVFNIADVYITLGVLYAIRQERNRPDTKQL